MRLTRAKLKTLAAAVGIGLFLSWTPDAPAFTLGAADGSPEAAPIAAAMGARTYRVVMDPAYPLDHYAPRIDAYRAAGMSPQLVVGGVGTRDHANHRGLVPYALAAARRWPDAYAIGVVNEPNLSGMSACTYRRTYVRARQALKRANPHVRVLFGEWSPTAPLEWTQAVLSRCTTAKLIVDGFAWHCYDAHPAWLGPTQAWKVTAALRKWRARISTPRGFRPALYCTEYGQPTRGEFVIADEADAAQRWCNALAGATKADNRLAQIVVWQIRESEEGSPWDTSLVTRDGRERAAMQAIMARAGA